MKDKWINFVSKDIYKFEYTELPPSPGQESITERYIKLELSRDNFKKFYGFIEKKPTNMAIEITIYDEGTNNTLNYRETLLYLIKTLNNLNIKNITFILSDSTMPIYNNYMKILGWKHSNKTKLIMKIDRNAISEETRNWNLSEAQGTINLPEEKLIWLSDYQLEQLNGIIDEQILKKTIELKKSIIFIDKYLRERCQIEKMNDFDKVYLIYELIKTQIRFPWKYVDIINGREVLKEDHPAYISEPHGTWINKEGTSEGQARLMVTLLNNPIMKIDATTINGEVPQGRHTWVGIIINGKLYQCCNTMNGPFRNLDKLEYTINEEQIYPTIYEHAFLSEREINKIKRKIQILKK